MAGIAYESKIIIYTRKEPELDGAETWYGVEQDSVRISYTKGRSYGIEGAVHTSTLTLSIYDEDLTNGVDPRTFSEDTYIAIIYDAGTGFEAEAPTGRIHDERYENGLIAYLQNEGIKTVKLTEIRHYALIPHWEFEGR